MSRTKEIDTDKTYVYDGIEVKPTGRTAVKRRSRDPDKVAQRLYEVKPIDLEKGSWKKWVSPDKLFEIEELDNGEE